MPRDEIRLPKLGMDMVEARVVKWLVAAGEAVRKGDPVVEIETDKTNVVLEAPDSGVLDRIIVAENGVASAGDVLGIIATPDTPTLRSPWSGRAGAIAVAASGCGVGKSALS